MPMIAADRRRRRQHGRRDLASSARADGARLARRVFYARDAVVPAGQRPLAARAVHVNSRSVGREPLASTGVPPIGST